MKLHYEFIIDREEYYREEKIGDKVIQPVFNDNKISDVITKLQKYNKAYHSSLIGGYNLLLVKINPYIGIKI